MKKNKTLILAAASLVVLVALFLGVYALTRPDTTVGSKTVTVEVVHKNASTKTFTYQTDEEVLGDLLLNEGLVVGEFGEYGLYFKEVDGEVADFSVNGAYWALYEGEEYATQGADTTPLEDGDVFSLVYTLG